MIVLILSLVALFVVALLAGILRNRSLKKKLANGEIDEMPGIQHPQPAGCCGQHQVCPSDSLLAGMSKDIEYYEDEDLDAFRGREANDYTTEEVERFEDVLNTMREDEVAGWIRSLQLRGINLPTEVRDEALLIVGEIRA